MKWIEINICTTSEASEAITEKLIILGAYGISTRDPSEIKGIISDEKSLAYADEGYVESLGDDVFINAYFASIDDKIALGIKDEENNELLTTDKLYNMTKDQKCTYEELIDYIKRAVKSVSEYLDIGKGTVESKYIDDDDWANSWKKYYKPAKISERIVIVPSWEAYEPAEGERIVLLDPGSAFGTGSHATTSMCAEIIDSIIFKLEKIYTASENPEHFELKDKILDLGCGSGILSIIAGKLGATDIDAVDIDEVAVSVARDNIRKNGLDNAIRCFAGQASELKSGAYKIIVANIIADVLFDVSDEVKRLLQKNGYFIASGIIDSKKKRVVDKYISAGFELIETKEKEDWVALVFTKP